ncbi:phosphodiester glycosidase family protein [Paenibacillus thailandensis]|uniref:Phosphodiester glycosidase family protein n=1 Tax=Paenibacillus thailandensis TaxID=393250 RepID=A0ABW5QV01_9BACL
MQNINGAKKLAWGLKAAAMAALIATGASAAVPAGLLPSKAAAAEAAKQVDIAYPAASVQTPLNARVPVGDKIKLSEAVNVYYETGNPAIARVNSRGVLIPASSGNTKLVIKVSTPGYKGSLTLPVRVTAPASSAVITKAAKKVTVNGKTFNVQTVSVPKGTPVTAALPQRKVGLVQGLKDIAVSYNADAAINGTYFEAYGGIPEPYGMIMSDGIMEHVGNTGTTIGFQWDGKAVMDTLRVSIKGGTNGSFGYPNGWYAYFINRTPEKGKASAILFTPRRGTHIGFAYGKMITVSKGVVTKIETNVNAAIPKDGYVIVFNGSDASLADRFKPGMTVDYQIETTNADGKTVDWSQVHTAIGAGPTLVKDGKVQVDPVKEGFTSDKILTGGGARSGIAVMNDGSIMLATVPGATIKQWAEIMAKLGAKQAMNLDGGASSGLYAKGQTITPPGRQIGNALVFGGKLKW